MLFYCVVGTSICSLPEWQLGLAAVSFVRTMREEIASWSVNDHIACRLPDRLSVTIVCTLIKLSELPRARLSRPLLKHCVLSLRVMNLRYGRLGIAVFVMPASTASKSRSRLQASASAPSQRPSVVTLATQASSLDPPLATDATRPRTSSTSSLATCKAPCPLPALEEPNMPSL